MAYDWTGNAEGGQAERLPVGQDTDVEITKLVFAKKDGTPFRSQAGDPKIMLIFADDDGGACSLLVTLSAKAGWRLASILSCAGADLDRMKADGIEPIHFADPDFANANLVGRRLRIRVKGYVGTDGNLAEEIVTIRRPAGAAPATRPAAGSPPAASQPADEPPIADDEIPF